MPLAVRRRVLRQTSDKAREEARRSISLRSAGIGPKTEQRYSSAMARLVPLLERANSMDDLDSITEEWVEASWAKGVPLGILGDALCGAHYFWPQVKGFLKASWRLFRNWRRLEVLLRAAPLPLTVVKPMIGLAMELDFAEVAFLLALGYHCYLRTGEILRIKFSDISADSVQGVVRIPAGESGLRFNIEEAVAIYDKEVLRLWSILHAAYPRARGCIWSHTGEKFRKCFQELTFALHVEACSFQCYSLRRGGATHHYMTRRTIDAILIRDVDGEAFKLPACILKTAWLTLQTLNFPRKPQKSSNNTALDFIPLFLLERQRCVSDRGNPAHWRWFAFGKDSSR